MSSRPKGVPYGFRIIVDHPDQSSEPITVRPREKAAGTTTIGPTDLRVVDEGEDGGVSKVTYELDSSVPKHRMVELVVTVHRRVEGPEQIATIEVQNWGHRRVRQVQFPYLEARGVETFDNLLMSSAWGDCIERPTKTIREITTGHSYMGQDYVVWNPNEVIYSYPSIMAMQYMVLFNQSRSIYVASYSTGDSTMTFNAKAVDARSLDLSVNHYPFLVNGTWKSPECSSAVLGGGWHPAADLYAARMGAALEDPDVPEWMNREFHGWGQIQMKIHGRRPMYRFADLPDVFRRLKEVGINTANIAGWAGPAFDMRYPEFDPNPELGTVDDLRSALTEIREMGCHAILYTNGRLVDIESDFFRQGGDTEVILKEDGTPYQETYWSSPSVFQIACPSSGAYREYFTDQVRSIVSDYGGHAIQIDQISCNYAPFCHDTRHSHPTPATNFLRGVDENLKAVRKLHKDLDPEFFVWCEGCHERFGRYYDVNQGHGEEHTWQIGRSIPEQFLYTYPGRIVTGLSQSLQQLCYAYAQGKPMDFPFAGLEDPEFAGLVKRFVDIRTAFPEFFFEGVFVHDRGITTTAGARAFGRIDEKGARTMVTLWRPGVGLDETGTALVAVEGAEAPAKLVYPGDLHVTKMAPEGKAAPSGDCYAFEWTGPVCTAVFGGGPKPRAPV